MALEDLLKYRPGGGGSNEFTQLLQMLQQSGARQEERRYRAQESMYKIFSDDLKDDKTAYNNTAIAQQKIQFDKYYEDNKGNMDDNTTDKFEMLSAKYKLQEDSNKSYEDGKLLARKYGENVEKILTEYSDIGAETSFTEIDVDGNEVNIEFDNIEDLENYRNDLRIKKSTELATKIKDYNEFQSIFIAEHNDRLSNKAFEKDSMYLDNLNEMFVFGTLQVEDDGLFDKKEQQAYQMGILNGSTQPIRAYLSDEKAITNKLNTTQMAEMQTIYGNTEYMSDIVTKFNTWDSIEDLEEKAKKSEEVLFTDEDGNNITYEEAADEGSDSSVILNQYASESAKNLAKLKNLDSNYTRRVGTSLLDKDNPNTINVSGDEVYSSNIDALNDPFKKPPPPPPPPPTTATITTPSSELNIKEINVSEDVNAIKSWAVPEMEKTGKKLNQLKSDIDNFSYDLYGSGSLRKILGKSGDHPQGIDLLSYNDLKQLEKSYNSDAEDMNKLAEEYEKMKKFGIKKNDPRRSELKSKIIRIYSKWTQTYWTGGTLGSLEEELERGGYKFSQDTPFEGLKFAKRKLNFLLDEHERLESKYKKDLEKTKK